MKMPAKNMRVSPEAATLEAKAEDAAKFLEMLANPRRLMILCELANGERSVGELVPIVGLQQAALSQHLARLREQKLVATRRESQMIYYRLNNPSVMAVIDVLADIFCRPAQSKRSVKR
jgi:DNA-binding transcriptional ArsR family regulator